MTRLTRSRRPLRAALAGILVLGLAACSAPAPAPESIAPPAPIGDFKLGYAIVVAKDAQKGPLSRTATPDELAAAMKSELERVFRPIEGSRFYHIAVTIDAYVLALPGIPIVASPKSALIFTVRIWDDARQKQLFEEPKQFTVIEKFTPRSIFGSGLTLTRQQQLAELARSGVKQIESWMRKNESLFRDPDKDATDS